MSTVWTDPMPSAFEPRGLRLHYDVMEASPAGGVNVLDFILADLWTYSRIQPPRIRANANVLLEIASCAIESQARFMPPEPRPAHGDRVYCLYCETRNPADRDLCQACGAPLKVQADALPDKAIGVRAAYYVNKWGGGGQVKLVEDGRLPDKTLVVEVM